MNYKRKYETELPHGNYIHNLLKARGIEDIENFLEPTEEHLHSPYLLDNLESGVRLVEEHLKLNSTIGLIVDCDADGICSAAIIYLYLRQIQPQIQIRWTTHTGKIHGIVDKIDWILDSKIQLLIVPDAGSSEYDLHKKLAQDYGIDILVLDHHEASSYSKDATIINNQLSVNYPNKALSGAGVTYKFCQALDNHYNLNFANNYLDLVALSLVSDVMNLTTLENRYIIETGFAAINNKAFQELVKKQDYSMQSQVNPTTVAWFIGPLINAVTRAGTQEENDDMFIAFIDPYARLKSTKKGAKINDIELAYEKLARASSNIRNRQNKLKEQAIEAIQSKIERENLTQHKLLVITLNKEEAKLVPSTLTGLVAAHFMSEYKRPTLLGRISEFKNGTKYPSKIIRGSIRSDDLFGFGGLKTFLENSKLMEYVQGHENASGWSLDFNNLSQLLDYADAELASFNFEEKQYLVDYIFQSNEAIAPAILNLAAKPMLWGQGNPEPLIVVENVQISRDDVACIGANKDTVKFRINKVDFIKFKDEEYKKKLLENNWSKLTILGNVALNSFRGTTTPQILVRDYDISCSDDDF